VSEAERIKNCFGSAALQMVKDQKQIEIIHGGQERMVLQRHVSEILQARTEEFLDLVRGEFLSCSGCNTASTGVVLTGGGALLQGLVTAAENRWNVPVRLGSLTDIQRLQDMANNPGCATGAGLVLYAFDALSNRLCAQDLVTGVFGKMKDWAKELFKIKKGGIEYVRN
jgi:cell division protein FtsA